MILVIIDVQQGLDDPQYGSRNNPDCEDNIRILLAAWRSSGQPVLFTRHLSMRAGSPLAESDPRSQLKSTVAPVTTEQVFTKTSNSIFKSGDFRAAVEQFRDRHLVLAGLATDVCVSATAREAHDLGYQVAVVSDGCATYERALRQGRRFPAEVVHDVALASLAVSGIEILSAAQAVERSIRARAEGFELV